MKQRPTTKASNQRAIIVNYAVAIIFISIGLYTEQSIWYVGGSLDEEEKKSHISA